MPQKRILCVCMGNTCRSPMIEALVRQGLTERGVDVLVESCGLLPRLEEEFTAANEHSVEMMQIEGLDISGHKPRHIDAVGDLSPFDAIIVVNDNVKAGVVEQGADEDKIIVLNGAGGGVPDPFNRGREAYVACIATIKASLPEVIAVL